jgi:hypothetical protein
MLEFLLCPFKPKNGISIEWFIYFMIELLLISLFILSVYNVIKFDEYHQQDILLKDIMNITVECILIIIGLFMIKIIYTKKINDLQICFCRHIAPFLILTGITTIINTSKKIQHD